uniref:UNC93-like protein MFSD11 n=1 Tax=Plectus sambesii TaxID=2011161 RepID=A0A914XCW1_9BILA
MEARTWNIIQLGVGFMLLFAGFNTQNFVEQTVLNSVAEDTGRVDEHAGYYSLAIVYGCLTVGNLVAAPIIAVIGAKVAMIIGSLTYVLFLLSFLYVDSWSLYLVSAINGLGGALLWTGQGNYMTLNSDDFTAGRNSGIVWAIYQLCLVSGGTFLFIVFQFTDKHFDQSTIRILYSVFAVLGALGVLTFVFLRQPPKQESSSQKEQKHDHVKNILATFKLMFSKDMMILSVMFMYSGIELTFWSGIYSTSLAFTNKLADVAGNNMLAYNAVAIGLGQIMGGTIFGVFGERTNKFGRYPIVLLGCVTHLLCFALIFINIPTQAAIHKTDDISIISPSIPLALLCSALLGFGDSCWNTQIYSMLATFYKKQSSEGFAVMKFFNCLSACAAFFYGSKIELRYQLGILAVGALLAFVCFFGVERKNTAARVQSKISTSSEVSIVKALY